VTTHTTSSRLCIIATLVTSAVTAGCGNGLDPASKLAGVRLLAVETDSPFAAPGATVTAQVLAFDGRAEQPEPMRLYWLTEPCLAPGGGRVSDCYRRFSSQYAQGQVLTSADPPAVVEGNTAIFRVPSDALLAAVPDRTGVASSAMLIFVAACAGRLQMVGARPAFPDESPIGCIDASDARLGARDFVFGFARISVFAEEQNLNPVISGLTIDGAPVEEGTPFPVASCPAANADDCPGHQVSVLLPDDTSELDPGSVASGATPNHEQVWASFFATSGKLDAESVILFDARHGRVANAHNTFRAPASPGDITLFVVAHDNRDGVSWRQLTLQSQ
jgi:hypothetical protein